MRNRIALLLAFALVVSGPAQADPMLEFADRLSQSKGVSAVVNKRLDGSFGSVSIGIQPEAVSDASRSERLMQEIGAFAAAQSLRVIVVTPTAEDAARLKTIIASAGVADIGERVMAEGVTIKVTRIFLTPTAKTQ